MYDTRVRKIQTLSQNYSPRLASPRAGYSKFQASCDAEQYMYMSACIITGNVQRGQLCRDYSGTVLIHGHFQWLKHEQ
jgi:hypothetical protein